jgi:transcriptional regulator with XRE-family HTH domain
MAPGRPSSVARSWYRPYHPAHLEDNCVMRRADEFGRFLRSRRARVEPEMVGLQPGDRRRVDGLRREELAQLASVSVDYLIRLEQGRIERPSPEIVDALARALFLDPSERRHLFRLAAASEPTAGLGDGTSVRAGVRLLIDTLDRIPAVLLSRRLDLLYWNPIAEALLGPFPDHRNYARMVIRDPAQRRLHADWEEAARQTAALLRYAAARHPEDAQLRALVTELDGADPHFSVWWNAHDVEEKRHGAKTYLHPTADELTLTYEALPMPDDGDQILTVFTAEPDTVDAERLAALALTSVPPGV